MTYTLAISRSPRTEPLFKDPAWTVIPHSPITRAFAPMVRTQAFDASEMALLTFLQARAHGSDLVLLPVVLTARHPQATLLRRANDPFGPQDLAHRRIGVRAYSQTTALWLRGILADETGLDPATMHWTTFEPAHVANVQDPSWCTRAAPGSDLATMLREGQLDAAIFGADAPASPDLVPVFPDPAAAAAFHRQHGVTPINHMVVTRPTTPAAAILPHLAPEDPASLAPALTLALRYATNQGLLPRPLTLQELWAAPPS